MAREYGAVAPTGKREKEDKSKVTLGVCILGLLVVGLCATTWAPKDAELAPVEAGALKAKGGQQALQEEGGEAPAAEAAAAEPAAEGEGGKEGGEKEEIGIDTADLIPKKAEGGLVKHVEESVEEAVTEKPNAKNAHYVKEANDKEVHLLIIAFLLLGTATVYLFCKTNNNQSKLTEGISNVWEGAVGGVQGIFAKKEEKEESKDPESPAKPPTPQAAPKPAAAKAEAKGEAKPAGKAAAKAEEVPTGGDSEFV